MSGKRELLAPLRAAVEHYEMIAPGDAVAVGVSGGKDSVALLTLLSRLRRFYPAPFTLTAITLDPQFDGTPGDYSEIQRLCDRLEVPYVLQRTHLWEAASQAQGDKPCSLCAKLRRGALHKAAVEAGCNVVALGHHQDDAAETVLMNLLGGGTLGCFSPKSYLDRRGLTLIRPMVYLSEGELAAFVRREGLPTVASRCPVDGCTGRQEMKQLLAQLSRQYGPLSRKLTDALKKAGLSGW